MAEVQSQRQEPNWRTWLARVVVLSALVMAMFTWQRFQPLECLLAFGFGPTIRAEDGGGLTREEIRRIKGRVFGADKQEVARLDQTLADGLTGPTTPPVILRIPPGSYQLHLEIEGVGGRKVVRTADLEITEAGYQSLDVD
jgi:hypothetical protein